MDGTQSILASTSLALEPLSVIRLYSYQFRIECTFRELLGKQPELRITQIIQEQQDESGTYWGSWAS
jgi:hypothetical protein